MAKTTTKLSKSTTRSKKPTQRKRKNSSSATAATKSKKSKLTTNSATVRKRNNNNETLKKASSKSSDSDIDDDYNTSNDIDDDNDSVVELKKTVTKTKITNDNKKSKSRSNGSDSDSDLDFFVKYDNSNNNDDKSNSLNNKKKTSLDVTKDETALVDDDTHKFDIPDDWPVQLDDPEIDDGLDESFHGNDKHNTNSARTLPIGRAVRACSGCDIVFTKSAASTLQQKTISVNNLNANGSTSISTANASNRYLAIFPGVLSINGLVKNTTTSDVTNTIVPNNNQSSDLNGITCTQLSTLTQDTQLQSQNTHDANIEDNDQTKKGFEELPLTQTDVSLHQTVDSITKSNTKVVKQQIGTIQGLSTSDCPILTLPIDNTNQLQFSGQRVQTSSIFLLLTLQPTSASMAAVAVGVGSASTSAKKVSTSTRKSKVICKSVFNEVYVFGQPTIVATKETNNKLISSLNCDTIPNDDTIIEQQQPQHLRHRGASSRTIDGGGPCMIYPNQLSTTTPLQSGVPRQNKKMKSKSNNRSDEIDENDSDDDDDDNDMNKEDSVRKGTRVDNSDDEGNSSASSSADEYQCNTTFTQESLSQRRLSTRTSSLKKKVKYAEDDEQNDVDTTSDDDNDNDNDNNDDDDDDGSDVKRNSMSSKSEKSDNNMKGKIKEIKKRGSIIKTDNKDAKKGDRLLPSTQSKVIPVAQKKKSVNNTKRVESVKKVSSMEELSSDDESCNDVSSGKRSAVARRSKSEKTSSSKGVKLSNTGKKKKKDEQQDDESVKRKGIDDDVVECSDNTDDQDDDDSLDAMKGNKRRRKQRTCAVIKHTSPASIVDLFSSDSGGDNDDDDSKVQDELSMKLGVSTRRGKSINNANARPKRNRPQQNTTKQTESRINDNGNHSVTTTKVIPKSRKDLFAETDQLQPAVTTPSTKGATASTCEQSSKMDVLGKVDMNELPEKDIVPVQISEKHCAKTNTTQVDDDDIQILSPSTVQKQIVNSESKRQSRRLLSASTPTNEIVEITNADDYSKCAVNVDSESMIRVNESNTSSIIDNNGSSGLIEVDDVNDENAASKDNINTGSKTQKIDNVVEKKSNYDIVAVVVSAIPAVLSVAASTTPPVSANATPPTSGRRRRQQVPTSENSKKRQRSFLQIQDDEFNFLS